MTVDGAPFFSHVTVTVPTRSHPHGIRGVIPPTVAPPTSQAVMAALKVTSLVMPGLVMNRQKDGESMGGDPKIGGKKPPQIINFNRVFHYKPSILGVFPLFLETSI